MAQQAAQATTKDLYAVVPFTAMSYQHNNGLWECAVLNLPHTGSYATTQEEAESKAKIAVAITLLSMAAAHEIGSAIWENPFGVDDDDAW